MKEVILQVTVFQVSFFLRVIWVPPASRDPISDPLGSKSVSKTTEEERRGCEEGRQPFTKVHLGPAPGIICTRENSALLLVPSLELGFVILSGVTGVLKVVYFCQGLS